MRQGRDREGVHDVAARCAVAIGLGPATERTGAIENRIESGHEVGTRAAQRLGAMQREKDPRVVVLPDGNDDREGDTAPQSDAYRGAAVERLEPNRQRRHHSGREPGEQPYADVADRGRDRITNIGERAPPLVEEPAPQRVRAEKECEPEQRNSPERVIGKQDRDRDRATEGELREPASSLEEQLGEHGIIDAC